MDKDRNLLTGVLALQAGLIDDKQFVEACRSWAEKPGTALVDVLTEWGWLNKAGRARLELLLAEFVPPARANAATVGLEQPSSAATPHSATRAVLTPGHDQRTPLSSVSAEERYELGDLHATGGMGRVWRARDMLLDREVALKDLRPEVAFNGIVRSRFLREARITGQLEHPGIVPVYELAQRAVGAEPFYTMRFVKGRTLTEAAEAFHIGRQEGEPDMIAFASLLGAFVTVCNTIAYAHSRGVIHRDLKGNNVLLGDYGEVIVLDWGLAKRLGTGEAREETLDLPLPEAPDQTSQGEVMGTPAFMAPEQAAGEIDRIDQRSDIYGLGAVLFEILTGQPPFSGSDTLDVIGQVLRKTPYPPRTHWADVPAALEAACLRALAKEPRDRYQSAADLGQEVMKWQEVQRRAAEDALRRQTEVLQSILNSMSEAVLVADQEGKLLHFNPAAERLLGVRSSDTTIEETRQRYGLFRPDKKTPVAPEETPLLKAARGELTDDAELFVASPARPEGYWVSANARPLKDEKGALRGGVVVVRDISERKRIEEELRSSRERFELAVRGSQDGLWDWDLLTNVVYFSPRWKDIIGYADHEIAHRIEEWEIRLHPDEHDTVLAANQDHIKGRTPYYEHEYRLRHKDGTYRWILARGVALTDEHGKAYRMAGSHVDVTERKEAEEQARQVLECHQAVMAALPVAVVVLDAGGGVCEVNAAARQLLGAAAETGPFSLPKACRAEGTPLPQEELPPLVALRTGQACPATMLGLKEADGIRWLRASAAPILHERKPTGAVGVFVPVTS